MEGYFNLAIFFHFYYKVHWTWHVYAGNAKLLANPKTIRLVTVDHVVFSFIILFVKCLQNLLLPPYFRTCIVFLLPKILITIPFLLSTSYFTTDSNWKWWVHVVSGRVSITDLMLISAFHGPLAEQSYLSLFVCSFVVPLW